MYWTFLLQQDAQLSALATTQWHSWSCSSVSSQKISTNQTKLQGSNGTPARAQCKIIAWLWESPEGSRLCAAWYQQPPLACHPSCGLGKVSWVPSGHFPSRWAEAGGSSREKQQVGNTNPRALLQSELGLLVSSYTFQHRRFGRSKQEHLCSALAFE